MKKLPMTMVLLPLMTVGFTLMASTINVSGGGSALQKAIDKAKAGDVLLVEPGTYSAIDTQGKEIEIRSTKGPKQTFVSCGKCQKPWGMSFHAALLVPDDCSMAWIEGDDDEPLWPELVQKYHVEGVEWKDWTPTDMRGTTVVGFSFVKGKDNLSGGQFVVNGGRVVNCIFKDFDAEHGVNNVGCLHAAEAIGCLFVGKTVTGEVVCDCRCRNCTLVVGGSSVFSAHSGHVKDNYTITCSELLNTIVYASNDKVTIVWGDYQPRMENLVCFNVADIYGEDTPVNLSATVVKADPLFSDVLNGGYDLRADSPCVDTGDNAYSAYDADLNGGARIVNGTVDIGAYEYGSAPLYEESEGLEPSYGPFVPGEKVSLTIPALVGYAAKGLPSGLKLDKKTGEIAGAAKKSTGDAGVTVTFTKKNEPTLTAQFVVGPMPTIEIALAGDTEKCKVKGAGPYLVGKKVSLSATASKGTAFVGWTANGAPWPNAEDAKKAKLSYVMTKESVSLVATFEKEKMRVACPALAVASFTVGVAGDATGIPIEIETQSGVKSVAVSKLPAGMKYDKKTGRIVGAPTKAGSFDVTIKVTAKSGAVETLVVPVKVAALPDWAVGTFVGMVRQVDYDAQGNVVVDADGRHDWYDGEMTVTVSAKGKISGKLTLPGGEKGAFSCSAYASCGEEGCVATGSMKIGTSLKVDVELCVMARSLAGGDADFAGDVEVRMYGNEGTESLIAFSTDESRPLRQQVWKSKVLPLPPSVDKKSVTMERDGFLYTLNFGKNGVVDDMLASADNPRKAIKRGKPVFSIVGFWDSVWHCELFGTPVVDTANGGEERLRVNVNIASDGSLSCALAE